jgi:hypothetical protein
MTNKGSALVITSINHYPFQCRARLCVLRVFLLCVLCGLKSKSGMLNAEECTFSINP